MLSQRGIITSIYFWLRQGDKSTLLRWMILFGVLSVAALLPWMGREREMMLLIAGMVGIGGLWFLLRWPPMGVFVAIFGGMVIRFHGPSGLNITMIVLAMAVGLWLATMLLHQKRVALLPSITNLPLLVMVVMGFLSFGFGQLPWYAFADAAPLGAQIASLTVLIISAGAFLLVGNQFVDLRWLQALVWIFLAVATLYMLGRVLPPVRLITGNLFQGGMQGSLFWVWVVALSFSQAIFNHHLRPIWRILLLGLVLLTFFIAYGQSSGWKSGWVPALITVGAVLVAYSWRWGLIMSPFAIMAGIALSGYIIGTDEYSYSTRVDAWIIMANLIAESPILGLGWANYRWFTPLFPIRGYSVYFNSHSQYIDILAQTGFVGLITFFWFFAAVGLLGWKLRKRVPEGFPLAYVYGALGGLVGTLVAGAFGDWILPYFYNVGLVGVRASILAWIFLGGLVVLEQMIKKDRKAGVQA
jgi:hypothetical protein